MSSPGTADEWYSQSDKECDASSDEGTGGSGKGKVPPLKLSLKGHKYEDSSEDLTEAKETTSSRVSSLEGEEVEVCGCGQPVLHVPEADQTKEDAPVSIYLRERA